MFYRIRIRKIMVVKFCLYILVFILIYACEYTESYCGSGTVYDAETKLPIDKAIVLIKVDGNRDDIVSLTDEDGEFTHCSSDYECIFPFDCDDHIKLIILKTGYHEKEVSIGDGLEIYLDKDENWIPPGNVN